MKEYLRDGLPDTQGDRVDAEIHELEGDLPVEPRVDPTGRAMDKQSQTGERRLALNLRPEIGRQGDTLRGRPEKEVPGQDFHHAICLESEMQAIGLDERRIQRQVD